MDRRNDSTKKNRNSFTGAALISLLLEADPEYFTNREAALEFARRLFREGYVVCASGTKDFEDCAQLYSWHDEGFCELNYQQCQTSLSSSSHSPQLRSHKNLNWKFIQDIKHKLLNRTEINNNNNNNNNETSYNLFYQELQQNSGLNPTIDFNKNSLQSGGDINWSSCNKPLTSTLELKKGASCSTKNNLIHQNDCPNVIDEGSHRISHLNNLVSNLRSENNFLNIDHSTSHSHNVSPSTSHHHNQNGVRLNNLPKYQQQENSNSNKSLSNHKQPHSNSKQSHSNSKQSHSNSKQSHSNSKQSHSNSKQSHSNSKEAQKTREDMANVVKHLTNDRSLYPSHEKTFITNVKHNTDQPHPSSSSAAVMDNFNQQTTSSCVQVSSVAVESIENKGGTKSEFIGHASGDRGRRWSQRPMIDQTPKASPQTQMWLNPNVSPCCRSPAWESVNNRTENDNGPERGHSSRWSDNAGCDEIDGGGRRWPESANSYSDNEKQLLEEMKRMKKEHQNVLRTYEGRINKLMTKMHELRNIAEMLEHSSNKSSPYGVLPGKLALLKIFGRESIDVKNAAVDVKNIALDSGAAEVEQMPPPLPPRPGRGSRVYPNKPIIHTNVAMRPLHWSRIILDNDTKSEQSLTIWHGMTEPTIDTDELQRLFPGSHDASTEVSLYDDVALRRGKTNSQLVTLFDAEKSQRITSELRALHCSLPQVIQAFVTFNCDGIHTESFAELLELLMSPRELDKISQHVQARGAGQLDVPEFLVFELSKVNHFRERLEFLRFKNKIQINLFEIDLQLRELQTACEEITSSISLKHVLETVLAVGNHMNAGTNRGQADGFRVDVLNSLKEMKDLCKQCNLLELVMRMYCLKFESDLNFGCPTRFRLPEPSNMRHAAQVSFEDIQRALKELKDELSIVRNKLESVSKQDGSSMALALRVASENFMTSAVEVLADEQKLLEETRNLFWKTASYFSYDGQKSTPREFFQIWASFLHDCKYYWKLAHRNLAKAKFNTNFIAKNQLSCSSLPGFNSLKSAMMKQVASFQQKEEIMSTKSQQLQHITSWIQSVGQYTLEMQPDCVDVSLDTNDIVGQHDNVGHTEALTVHGQQNLQPHQEYNHGKHQEYNHGKHQEYNHEKHQEYIHGKHQEYIHGKHQEYNPGNHQEHNHAKQASSLPYVNQKFSEHVDFQKQFEPMNKQKINGVKAMPSKSSKHIISEPQTPSSPNIMRSAPSNITSQPAMHTPNQTSLHKNHTKPMFVQPSQTNNPDTQRNITETEDITGIEPFYESLSHFSHNFLDLQSKKVATKSLEDLGAFATPALPSDSDNSQRKKFFKSLLKRDQKRSPVQEDGSQSTPAAIHKSSSTPFTKVKNTFVHKFSGNENKNLNNDSKKDELPYNINSSLRTSNNGLSSEHTPSNSSAKRDSAHFDNSRGDQTDSNPVNYQNLLFSRPTDSTRQTYTPESLEVNQHHNEHLFYSGHESFPSTVSSLQSLRNKSRSHYQGNILHRHEDSTNMQSESNSKISEEEHLNLQHNINKVSGYEHPGHNTNNKLVADNSRGGHSSQARVRAAIALGSNMSISDVYGRETENAETQTSGNYDYQATLSCTNDPSHDRNGSSNKAIAKSAGSNPKWVKASPVPVYQAKLIPNYENQSKYDPRFEAGVKGRAEAVSAPRHAQQQSTTSYVYKQEVQRKSDQYTGRNIHPAPCQTPNSSNSLRSTSSLGTSCSIQPSKPNHYQAFPITFSKINQQVNSTPGLNYPQSINPTPRLSYPQTSNNVSEQFQAVNFNQTNEFKNNPENGEIVLSSDYAHQQNRLSNLQTRPGDGDSQTNIKAETQRKQIINSSCNALSTKADKNKTLRGDKFSAYRSSSAHSFLDRGGKLQGRERSPHFLYPGHENEERKTHASRKHFVGKKSTPTSFRGNTEVKKDVPQSVTSLINKFEKGADLNQGSIGLLEITDKPPSMTSTPVARRRNQGVITVQPSHEKRTVGPEDENSKPISGGPRRSLFPKEEIIPGRQKIMIQPAMSNNNLELHGYGFRDSNYETVDIQHNQQQNVDKERTVLSQEEMLKQSEDYKELDYFARKYQQPESNMNHGDSYVVMYPSNQKQQELREFNLPNSHPGYTNINEIMAHNQIQSGYLRTSSHNSQNKTSAQSSVTAMSALDSHTSGMLRQHQQLPNCSDSVSASHVISNQPHWQPSSSAYNNQQQQRQPHPTNHNSHLTPHEPTSQFYGSSSSGSPQRRKSDSNTHSNNRQSNLEPFPRTGHLYGRQTGALAVVKPTVMNI